MLRLCRVRSVVWGGDPGIKKVVELFSCSVRWLGDFFVFFRVFLSMFLEEAPCVLLMKRLQSYLVRVGWLCRCFVFGE